MQNVIVIAIWENEDSVFTKHLEVTAKSKPFKYMGKKPDKLIVPESAMNKRSERVFKSLCKYTAKIVIAVGK